MRFNIEMGEAITYNMVGIIFGVTATAVLIVVWLFAIFQTKRAAKEDKQELKSHILRVEANVDRMRTDLATIGGNVQYIRGRLEPKT